MSKKIVKMFSLILILLFSFISVADADVVAEHFCSDIKQTLQLIGVFVLLLRVAVPLIIVVMGTLDFYKSVTSGDMADVKKGATILGQRVVIGLLIFYLTTIVNYVSRNVGKVNDDYQVCINCIDKPFSCN